MLSALLLISFFNMNAQEPTVAQDAVSESRTHFELKSQDGFADFTCTLVERVSEKLLSTRVLLQDPLGERFLISSVHDFEHQTATREIREIGGSDFLRYTMFLPYSAKTMSATRAEAHAHPELLHDSNTKFELSAAGNSSISGIASFWKDPPTALQWRSRARLMLSAEFLNSLEFLETVGIFRDQSIPDMDSIVMPLVLYRTECRLDVHLMKTALPPDCGFDSKFGVDCSDKQKETATKFNAERPPRAKAY
ncbi:MAG TPA: hypothetical protein VGJ82_05705 [Thermoanaerobaculia bacterium]